MNKSEAGKLGYAKTVSSLLLHVKEQKEEAYRRFEALNKICFFCQKPLTYEQRKNRFCGHSCFAAYNNRKRERKKSSPYSDQLCPCGKQAIKWRKYCPDCIKERKFNIKDLSKIKGDHGRKRYLLRTREHRCAICLTDKWMGEEIPLIMDHIDGNSEHNTDENLRLICPNCDALLPTYKGKNKGNGRVARRKRYAEGKSY